MTCEVISTGSSGNSVLINETVLIDIGVPFKKLESFYRKINLVLLTHSHS